MTNASSQAAATAITSPKKLAQDDTKIGGYAYQIITQQSQRVFGLRSQVIADKDIENLHEMRIATRRLSAAVQLFADVINTQSVVKGDETNGDSSAKLVKSLKKLIRALGKVRDIDVMQVWFSKLEGIDKKMLGKKEKKVIQSLLKTLKKRRKKEFSKLEDTLNSSSYKKLAKQFKQWSKQPDFQPAAQQLASDVAISKIIEPLTQLFQHAGWRIATRTANGQAQPLKSLTLAKLNTILTEDGEQLHELRKQIKLTRYQTEFFRGLYGITYTAKVREFRTMQKVLGQLQDQLVVSDFLTAELGADWAKQLPSIEGAFQASRLALWQQWQPLQQRYLQLGTGKIAA